MSNKPVIIQFESDENYITVADLICFNMDLNISHVARNVAEAKQFIEQIGKQKLKPDIAIVCNVLLRNLNEGRQLAKKLREVRPQLKIIAFSEIPDIDWADELAIKSGKDNEHTLITALHKLTKKEFKSKNN